MVNTSANSQSVSTPESPTARRDRVRPPMVRLTPPALVGCLIGFAVLFGLLAVFLAQIWLNNQADERLKSIEALRFDSSGLVVTATYESTDKRTQLAQYSVDPRDWQRHLCGLVKGSMTQLALLKVLKERNFDDQHGFTFQNACGLPSSRLSRN